MATFWFLWQSSSGKEKESWQLLKLLKPLEQTTWLCMVDFNEVLCNEEKSGGATRPFSQMQRFREALEFYEFSDQGY